MIQCQKTTKNQSRCKLEARPSGWCHIHDWAVQCRALNRKGKPCRIATGGGRCANHQGQPHHMQKSEITQRSIDTFLDDMDRERVAW